MLDLERVTSALAADGRFAGFALEALPGKGLAHEHVRLLGSGALLRLPKQSQLGLPPAANLAYQAACFTRVAVSGHGPRLLGVLPPSPELPRGALLVEEILGRPPRLPEELPLIARALAAIHRLPLPPRRMRPPLADQRDPIADLLREILGQAAYLPEAGLMRASLRVIEEELAWAKAFPAEVSGRTPPATLALNDTHPGNFLITAEADGTSRAVIVDLEKAVYGASGVDLAHASVLTSTTWDPDSRQELAVEEVADFYARHAAALPEPLAEALAPWRLPLRRLLQLRALTWCGKWQVLHRRPSRRPEEGLAEARLGEDWSGELSDPATVAEVAGRVAFYLAPQTLELIAAEQRALAGIL